MNKTKAIQKYIREVTPKVMQKEEKGVAGLEILLSVVATLFVLGILIMAFVLSMTNMKDTTTDSTAVTVASETAVYLGDTTNWFPIFIVIAAMVVIVMLVVVIIVALRGSGLMGGSGAA